MEGIVDKKEVKELQLLNNLRQDIFQLERYAEVYDRGIGVLLHEKGDYVKFEDVLSLFSAKKE